VPHPEERLTGRERRRLRLGRENGYLNATCRNHQTLLSAYTRWCWHLRIPVVWVERRSPYSRYGRVRLDLYTSQLRLSPAGEAELRALAIRSSTSPHDGRWDFIPLRDLDRLARLVFRGAARPENHQPNHALPPQSPARQATALFVVGQRVATG
jgi:hypothetical protein